MSMMRAANDLLETGFSFFVMNSKSQLKKFAYDAYCRGEYLLATKLYELFREENPEFDAVAASFLAICYQECGQAFNSNRVLDEIFQNIQNEDDKFFYHLYRGRCKKMEGQFDEATISFRELIDSRPHSTLGYIYLADALIVIGKYQEAKACLLDSIERGADGERGDVYVNLGIVAISEQNLEEAKDCFLQALNVDPDCKASKFFLGQINEFLVIQKEVSVMTRTATD